MASDAPAAPAKLGEKNLSTIHAVAQALAIGPMFSTAIVLGLVSSPATGAAWNTPLSVLLAGLGVLSIGYVVALYARRKYVQALIPTQSQPAQPAIDAHQPSTGAVK